MTNSNQRIPIDEARPGTRVITTITANAGLLQQVETMLVEPIRQTSGYYCNRSRVFHAMMAIAADAAQWLDAERILDQKSLTEELRRAICARGYR